VKITNDEGVEVEVYTASEVAAKVKETETTVTAKLTEDFGKTKAQIDAELAETKKALGDRTSEFGKFRKLNDDAVAKLDVAQRTIYENQKFMADAKEKEETAQKDAKNKLIESVIRAKVGKDDKLFAKVKDMYSVLGIEANTQEEIEKKTLASLGALQTTEPDMVAAALGVNGGLWTPPVTKTDGEKSFADTEKGQFGAKELGLMTETPKKK
jgi:hypothetical protein